MSKKDSVVIFTMDDPSISFKMVKELIASKIKIDQVIFFENPKISLKRIIVMFLTYGLNFYNFLLKFFYWNVIKNGRTKDLLDKNSIQYLCLKKSDLSKLPSLLKKNKPDIILSIFCNTKLPLNILRTAKKHSINIHLGLLPIYRGLMPTFYAMINNDKYMAYTVHLMNKNFDEGAIFEIGKIKIDYGKNFYQNFLTLRDFSINRLIRFLKNNDIANLKAKKNNLKDGAYYSLPLYSQLYKYLALRLSSIFN